MSARNDRRLSYIIVADLGISIEELEEILQVIRRDFALLKQDMERVSQETEGEDIQNHTNIDAPLDNPTSTSRLDSEDQFERLRQKMDTKIGEGLTSTLAQFELRLEAALESLRQTVTTSLSARSQVVTEPEDETDLGHGSTGASRMPNMAERNYNRDDELDLDPLDVGSNNQVIGPAQFGFNASTREQPMANSHNPLFLPEEEDARIASIPDADANFNEKRCIICCLKFSIIPFSDKKPFKCAGCKLMVCQSCFCGNGTGFSGICRHCVERQRLHKEISFWFEERLHQRFKTPGSDKVKRSIMRYLEQDINNQYRDLKTGVQKDIEGKQSAIITEKAVKEEAKRMLKWLEAIDGKLKQSPLDNKSGKIEIDLKNAEDLEEEMKTKEAELTEVFTKMEGMSDQIGEEPCQQIAERLSQLKQEAALYFEESKEAWQSIDQSEASIMIALNTAEKLSSSSNRAELYADCSSLLEGIETLKGADKMCKQAMQENVKLNKSVNLLKDNLKISSPELNKKVSKLNQVIEETTAKVRSTVNAYQKELENRQSFLKNLKTLENQTGLTEGLLQDAISQKNSEATSAELESHISQIKNVLTQVDDLDSKKLSVAHQEQSWYKKKNLPKESAEKLSELEEMIENLKERAADALEGMKVSKEEKSEFENCLKQAKNVVKETQKDVNKLKESGKMQNSSEDSKSLQGKLEEVNKRLGEETKPLVVKMEEFLEKNPEETVLKQKVEEIVAGIQQTKSQITKSQSVAEQDKNLWEDYETSKAAAPSLAKLRKELQTVTQMDVSTEHNLDSAIQQLKELVEQLSHIDEIAPELNQKLSCIISQLGENSSTLSEKANKDDLVAEINSDKSAAEHILENLKEDKVLRENVLSSANNLLKFMADNCQVELDDVTNWSEQLSLLKNLEETMCTLTNIFNKTKENLANKVKENGGMPLPTQLSGKITEVVAKQPFVLKDLVALTEQCAYMLRVEQGLVNENIPQCSDWLDNAEQIVGKASDRDKAALEPNVEKEKCRIGSMKFSIRTLSDGGSSPSLIGQLSSTVSQLEERLKIVESSCKEAMKQLDNKSRLMSELSQLNDTVIQWSESGETVLAGASGKSGYEELAALHSNINDLLDQEESLDSNLSRMQEIAELLDDTGTDKNLDASTERLKTVADSLRKRLDQQTSTLEEWVELTEDMNKLQNWVEHTQKGLEKPEEHINVREQLQKKESLLAEIEVKREEATGLLGRKKRVSAALGEKQLTVEEENAFNYQLSMLEHETKEQQTVLKESVQIQDAYDRDVDRLKTLIEDAQKQMSSNPVKHKNIDALKEQIAEHKALRTEIQKYEKEIYALSEKTRQLARMGGRRSKKSSELRPLFSKGRPGPMSQPTKPAGT